MYHGILSASDLSSLFNGVPCRVRCLGAAGGVAELLQVLEVVPGHSTEALVVQTCTALVSVSNASGKCSKFGSKTSISSIDFRDYGINSSTWINLDQHLIP